MARSLWLVISRCSDSSREEEYNRWYDEVHLPDMLDYPEVVAAQRWLRVGPPSAGEPAKEYLTLYELDSDDPRGVLDRLRPIMPEQTSRGPRHHETAETISFTIFVALGPRREAQHPPAAE